MLFHVFGMLNGGMILFGSFSSEESVFEYLRATQLSHSLWKERSFRIRKGNGMMVLADEFMFNCWHELSE